jgi:hypothetical protein
MMPAELRDLGGAQLHNTARIIDSPAPDAMAHANIN